MNGLIILALILGLIGNTLSVGGMIWPFGSVIAVVIMGIYVKVNMDKHFKKLEEQAQQTSANETKE